MHSWFCYNTVCMNANYVNGITAVPHTYFVVRTLVTSEALAAVQPALDDSFSARLICVVVDLIKWKHLHASQRQIGAVHHAPGTLLLDVLLHSRRIRHNISGTIQESYSTIHARLMCTSIMTSSFTITEQCMHLTGRRRHMNRMCRWIMSARSRYPHARGHMVVFASRFNSSKCARRSAILKGSQSQPR